MRSIRKRKICYISNFVNLKYLFRKTVLTFLIGLLTHSLLLIIFRFPRLWRGLCSTICIYINFDIKQPNQKVYGSQVIKWFFKLKTHSIEPIGKIGLKGGLSTPTSEEIHYLSNVID